jgi:hypothetical protein
MDTETPAERLYRKHKEAMKTYYEKNRDKVLAKQMERYYATRPPPRKRGRPRKVPVATEVATEGVKV